jgi:predicted metal-binding membrane protein
MDGANAAADLAIRGTPVERALRRDRLIVVGGLAAVALLAWLFVLDGAGTGMSVGAMTTWQFPPPLRPHANAVWPAAYWAVMLLMWWGMMIAMMMPSAAPMILLYARVVRHAQNRGQLAPAAVPTAIFALGYLASWLGFSAAAVAAQWALERLGLMHMMMMWSLERWLTAALLIAAGAYQLSPLKEVCLRACRAPAAFLSRHWRPGRGGALRLGLVHGLYCVGCCWALMALLFAGGIMNLVWIGGLALFVLVEKTAPHGRTIARAAGAVLIAAGGYVLFV